MHNLALLIVSGFCAVLLLVPLPLHIRTRNTGALLLFGWLLFGDIVAFVNSILFWDSIDNAAPVWCDISESIGIMSALLSSNGCQGSRFSLIGFQSGLASCSLCIHRQLASIAASRTIGYDAETATPLSHHRPLLRYCPTVDFNGCRDCGASTSI